MRSAVPLLPFPEAGLPAGSRSERLPRTQRVTLKRSKNTAPRNTGIKRKTGGSSQILENAATTLSIAGFVVYDNRRQCQAAKDQGTLPSRYIIKNYPHPALYGTPGKKEGFISHNGIEYIFEAKWQSGSGSVDEKPPYIWEQFLKSPVANWIVWFDGPWWVKNLRGIAAVAWLRERVRAQCPLGRRLIVVNQNKEGREFFTKQFGGDR